MEHRWGQRQPINLMVRFFAMSGMTGVGRLMNISSSGAFLATTSPLRRLALVYLEPAAAPFWEIQSRRIAASVVRRDEIGVGLEWCEAAAETPSVFRRLSSLAGGLAEEERRPFREHSRSAANDG